MDEVTQRNSAMAAATNSACRGLNEQVQVLEEIVSGSEPRDVTGLV